MAKSRRSILLEDLGDQINSLPAQVPTNGFHPSLVGARSRRTGNVAEPTVTGLAGDAAHERDVRVLQNSLPTLDPDAIVFSEYSHRGREMTESHPSASSTPVGDLDTRWRLLAGKPAPAAPPGPVGGLTNRILAYTRPRFAAAILDRLDPQRGGLVIAGPKAAERMKLLADSSNAGPLLVDPAAYESYVATPTAPFALAEDRLTESALGNSLDDQMAAGATAALTPTGFIPASDVTTLAAAARAVRRLDRTDTILVAPIDVAMLTRVTIDRLVEILAVAACPVGLVLVGQFDPLDTKTSQAILNLRRLAASVPLLPIRTDFNAFDLVAHGAVAGAIGTGGSIRHAVSPLEKPRSWNLNDRSPSVLFPEIASWRRGSKIAELYGAGYGPYCECAECDGEKITRFLRPEHQQPALRHAVATWSYWATLLFQRPSLLERAKFWQTFCAGAVQHHKVIARQLRLATPLQPQRALVQWAELPAWPTIPRRRRS